MSPPFCCFCFSDGGMCTCGTTHTHVRSPVLAKKKKSRKIERESGGKFRKKGRSSTGVRTALAKLKGVLKSAAW
eukprot:856627-Rhodomonas_salina.2